MKTIVGLILPKPGILGITTNSGFMTKHLGDQTSGQIYHILRIGGTPTHFWIGVTTYYGGITHI